MPHPFVREAILVLDSRLTSVALRNQPGGAWAKLYKAGEFYIDLSCKPEAEGAVLLGRVIAKGQPTPAEGLSLWPPSGPPCPAALDASGGFRFVLGKGAYSLEIRLGSETYRVPGLEVW